MNELMYKPCRVLPVFEFCLKHAYALEVHTERLG